MWLNEGMASLYEAAKYDNVAGRLIPLNNFRVLAFKRDARLIKNRLDSMLNNSWNGGEGTDVLPDMALSRYLCFYMEQKRWLSDYLGNLRARANPDSVMTAEEARQVLLASCHMRDLQELETGFQQFIDEQLGIATRHGHLRRKFTRGLYERGRFR